MIINLKKNDTFANIIKKFLYSSERLNDGKLENKLQIFSDKSNNNNFCVYSIIFKVNELPNNRLEINRITFQEEGNSYHNVTSTTDEANKSPAIYNLSTEIFERDIYLGNDKYNDCFEMYLTEALKNMF